MSLKIITIGSFTINSSTISEDEVRAMQKAAQVPIGAATPAQKTANLQLFEDFQVSCRELGKKLAEKGATIFVGSDRLVDVDPYIVEGANQVEGKHTVVVYAPYEWPTTPFLSQQSNLRNIDFEYWRVPGPWQQATHHIIRKVDALVVIGGGNSTLQAGMAAPALAKPSVGVTAFNGAGEKVFNIFERNYAHSRMPGDLFESLKKPFKTPADADNIVRAIEHFAKAHPYRVPAGFLPRFVVLAAVFLLIFLWGKVLHDGAANTEKSKVAESKVAESKVAESKVAESKVAESKVAEEQKAEEQKAEEQKAERLVGLSQDIGESTSYLIYMLVISGMLGTALRAGLRLLQDQVIHFGDVLNELIVGVLLSFSLLVLYLAAGVLYQGDVLEVTPSNFRRIAVTVSAIALASAFLLETAAIEVRRRFGQSLQR